MGPPTNRCRLRPSRAPRPRLSRAGQRGARAGGRRARHDMLLLTTTGRHSGRPHAVPLLYLRVKGELAVIASYGGHPTHPDWHRNPLAEPHAEVQADGKSFPVIPRTAAPAE